MTAPRIPQPLPRRLAAFTLATVLVGIASPALAGVENPRDTPAVHAVHLDMALVKRLTAITRARNQIEDDPPLFMRTKDNHVPKTLDELVAEVRTCPPLEAAIKAQGFTTKEYLTAALAFADAAIGYQLRVSGNEEQVKGQNLSEQHIAFIKAHYAELAARESE